MTFRRLLRTYWRMAVAMAVGATLAGLYAHFVGCRTGTCPLTSSVWRAMLYGAFVGGLLGWPARATGGYGDERG